MSRSWPLFDLRIRTPRLVLRPLTDADAEALAELAVRGIHDPGTMPFLQPWTDEPDDVLRRNTLQWTWRQRTEWSPDRWNLGLGVWEGDTLVGLQDLGAHDFATLRTVETGSWLGRAFQGRGVGTEMRAAALHLAFAELGARRARSGAFDDNPASLGVSRALGYEPDGSAWHVRRGEEARVQRLLLTSERWAERRRADVAVEHLAPCLPMFGA